MPNDPTSKSVEEAKALLNCDMAAALYDGSDWKVAVHVNKVAHALDKARAEGVALPPAGSDSEARYKEILQMIEESPTRVATAYLQYEHELKSLREESARKFAEGVAQGREEAAKVCEDISVALYAEMDKPDSLDWDTTGRMGGVAERCERAIRSLPSPEGMG